MVTKEINGVSLPKNAFRIHESDKAVDVGAVCEILKGNLAAYWVHGFMDVQTCRKIVENFWSSGARTPRTDGVEGDFIGAYHYGKTTDEYLKDVQAHREGISSLFREIVDPTAKFRSLLSANACGWRVRPARENGRSAGDSRALYWTNAGTFSLEPHDDLAQLRNPKQKGFEIQNVKTVMAVNLYPEVPADSGQVRIWNIQPDDHTRENLGLEYTGFPYPPELMEGFNSVTIPVATGDISLFNGAQVHAVLHGQPKSAGRRLLITFFMGLTQEGEILWWT